MLSVSPVLPTSSTLLSITRSDWRSALPAALHVRGVALDHKVRLAVGAPSTGSAALRVVGVALQLALAAIARSGSLRKLIRNHFPALHGMRIPI